MELLELLLLGIFSGTFGTLIGAGGGFILVPILLFLYPNEKPEFITSISLVVVFFNAVSGSIAYGLKKRIDYYTGALFSLATIPGSILAALTVSYFPRKFFNGAFGLLMIFLAIYLITRNEHHTKQIKEPKKNDVVRNITDADGNSYTFSYNPVKGAFISLFIGYFSTLMGIGGGIINVPLMVNVFGFPVFIATATSTFILSINSLTATITHLLSGKLIQGLWFVLALSVGAVMGAQIGARLSGIIKGKLIMRLISIALGIIGFRLLFKVFF